MDVAFERKYGQLVNTRMSRVAKENGQISTPVRYYLSLLLTGILQRIGGADDI
jgi:hypothetical protein